MKNFLAKTVLAMVLLGWIALISLFAASTANASVYVVPGYTWNGEYMEAAMSTNTYCVWSIYNTCYPTQARIAIKYSTGVDANKWIVVPPNYLMPQGVIDDINWAVNYVITNNIPARWGICYADGTPLTMYNVMNCKY